MKLLSALIALLCLYTPACGSEGCRGFRHLDNGRTFFRYSGLFVIFHCHPGFKLHGYKTNSCVSGHWSREPPVCVGSGCSNPGPLTHGTTSVNEDGSWAVFSCDRGFRLHGPSMIYCKGHTWNSSKPVCKEYDIMSSVSDLHQDLQAAVVLKTQQQSHYNTLTSTNSKEVKLRFGSLSHTPTQMSNRESFKETNSKVDLQQHVVLFPSIKVKDQIQTAHHEANEAQGPEIGSDGSDEKSEQMDQVSHIFVSKTDLSTTVSSTSSLASLATVSVSSPPSFPTAQTPSMTAVTDTEFRPTVIRLTNPVTSQDDVTLSAEASGSSTTEDKHQQDEPGSRTTETSPHTLSPSVYSFSTNFSTTSLASPLSSSSASASSSPSSSTQSSVKTQISNITLMSNSSSRGGAGSDWTEQHNLTTNTTSKLSPLSVILSRRPVCPYPPVPVHGTFYFRTVENPGPRVYRHYIQYACYPGYTLAHGDIHSYCQQGGRWSGVTPICLELTPCSVNNGGCSQLCSHSQHLNQTNNQTQSVAQCSCRPGFTLLDDGRTCRDVDECVEEQRQCQHRCINTFGSFKCGCDDGYELAPDLTSCLDVNECATNQGLGPCSDECTNSPGSYRCSCKYGHILAEEGHSCVSECPPGYRKQQTTAGNSTTQVQKDECVDINECEEETCEWQCVNLPGSHHCICPRGYTLKEEGRRCKDINECSSRNGGCSHLCLNQKGGYKCACPASHRLSPYSWKKCVLRTTAPPAG